MVDKLQIQPKVSSSREGGAQLKKDHFFHKPLAQKRGLLLAWELRATGRMWQTLEQIK